MLHANDNATDLVLSMFEKTERALSDPATLLADDIHSDLVDILMDEGYDMMNMESCRDLAVVCEMMRAMLYRQHGQYHAYQEILDEISIAYVPPPPEV